MIFDLKTLVDSVADGAISALGTFPSVAEKVAANATDYAAAVKRDLEDVKTNMPDKPEVIPRVAFGIIGQTVGAGLGMFGAIAAGVKESIDEIRAQTKRVTG